MKEELYFYSKSLYYKKISDTPKICVWILLTIFLFPTLLYKFWTGFVIVSTYTILYIFIQKEKEEYCKALLNWGVFLMYLGLEISILVLIQYNLVISLVVTTIIFIIAYEIYFGLNLKLKKYSRHKAKTSPLAYIVTLLCGGTGIGCGKVLAIIDNTNLKLWIVVIGCSTFIAGSLSFIQKAVIFKILEKQK